ncbi:GAF domain-containing protein [Natrialbaceae archaeon A-CW1-1]
METDLRGLPDVLIVGANTDGRDALENCLSSDGIDHERRVEGALDRLEGGGVDCLVVDGCVSEHDQAALLEWLQVNDPSCAVVRYGGSHTTTGKTDGSIELPYEPVTFPSYAVDALVEHVERVVARRRREAILRAIQTATPILFRASTPLEIAEATVESASTLLEQPLTTVFRYDERASHFEVVATTDEREAHGGIPPVIPFDGSLAGTAFGTQNPIGFDESTDTPMADADGLEVCRIDESDVLSDPANPMSSGLIWPLSTYGVLGIVATEPQAFTVDDVRFVRILAENATAALERTERERELEQRATQQQVVADLGQLALETDHIDELMDEAVSQVATILDSEYAKVLDLEEGGEELALRHGVGWDDGVVGEATVSATDADSQASYTLLHNQPIVVEDLESEPRFNGPELLTSHEVRSGVSTIIGPLDDPWGILGVHDHDRRTFAEEDVRFVKTIATVLAAAIERHQYQRELEQLVTDLRTSNEHLEMFSAIVSHDLRNPLSVAKGNLELHKETGVSDNEYLEAIEESLERMDDLIDDVLTLVRADIDEAALEWVAVGTTAERAWETVDTADASLELSSDLGSVRATPGPFRELLENVFDNAVIHGGDSVTVRVEPLQSGGFSVTDDGPGVPPEEYERIFEYGHSARTEGTGLGLAIVERVADAFGWTVDATGGADGGLRLEFRP